MKKKRFTTLLLRGVLGGALGGFVFAVVEVCLIRPTGWDNWLGYFLLIYIIGGLPFGVLIGAILAIVLWLIYQQIGLPLGLLARSMLGTAIGMIVVGIWWATAANSYQQSYKHTSWIVDLLGLVLLGAAFGGIPGIVIGAQRFNEGNPRANDLGNRESQSTISAEDR